MTHQQLPSRLVSFAALRGFLILIVLFLLASLGRGMAAPASPTVAPEPYLLWAPVGPLTLANLGNTVAAAGDVNRDGTPDFIAGLIVVASGDPGNAVAARVYSGATGALLWEIPRPSPTTASANSVAGVGDLNGDGYADFAVGTPGAARTTPLLMPEAGVLRVYSGRTGAVLWARVGESAGDLYGSSVAEVPDVNGDGVPEVLVGAHSRDSAGANAGSAYLLSGVDGSLVCLVNGEAVGDAFGLSVAGLSDVNGDGRGDFVVGAPMVNAERSGNGAAYLFLGFPQKCGLLHKWQGEKPGDAFGFAVANAGDVTMDSIPDVIVGAPGLARRVAGQPPAAGRAYVFSAAPGDGYNLKYTLDGSQVDDLFGHAVDGNGFCDGDKIPDLIVGAPQATGAVSYAGAVSLYAGVTGTKLLQFEGQDRADLLGASVAWVGQVTGTDPPGEMVVGVKGKDVGDRMAAGAAYVLSCQPVPKPEIQVMPPSLALGDIAPTVGARGHVTITNVGDAPLRMSAVELVTGLTSPDYSLVAPATPFSIAPGARRVISVTYHPTGLGADLGLLHIASSDLDEPDVYVSVSGRAIAPDIEVTPLSIDFGSSCTVGGTRSTIVTVRNQGNRNLRLAGLAFAPGSSPAFTLLGPPALPYTVGDGDSLALTVVFTPVNANGDTGTLQIASNDPDEPMVGISLQGRGCTNVPPVARGHYVPQTGGVPRTFTFSSSASFDPDGTIVGYLWNFGDGGTSTQANPQHTYGADGTYIALLTVTDDKGGRDVTSVAVEASQTPVRSRFYGTVKPQCGGSIGEGGRITAWVSNTLRAESEVMIVPGRGAVYALRVPGSAADEGLPVRFRVGNMPAYQTGLWKSQSDTELNLTVGICRYLPLSMK